MKARTLALSLIATGSLAGSAIGALTLNISDAGGGQTRWQFSGSTTIASGGPSSRNGFWFDDNNSTGFDTVGGNESPTPVSGTWSATVDGTTLSLSDVVIDSISGRIGIRTTPGPEFFTGDAVSWSGDFILNTPISNFAVGLFTSDTIGTVGDFQTLVDDTIFIVGAAQPIPEPSSTLLLGLGAMGLLTLRRKGR